MRVSGLPVMGRTRGRIHPGMPSLEAAGKARNAAVQQRSSAAVILSGRHHSRADRGQPSIPAGCRRGVRALGAAGGLPPAAAAGHAHRPLPLGRWGVPSLLQLAVLNTCSARHELSLCRSVAVAYTHWPPGSGLNCMLCQSIPAPARAAPMCLPRAAARARYLYVAAGAAGILAAANLLPRLAPWMA